MRISAHRQRRIRSSPACYPSPLSASASMPWPTLRARLPPQAALQTVLCYCQSAQTRPMGRGRLCGSTGVNRERLGFVVRKATGLSPQAYIHRELLSKRVTFFLTLHCKSLKLRFDWGFQDLGISTASSPAMKARLPAVSGERRCAHRNVAPPSMPHGLDFLPDRCKSRAAEGTTERSAGLFARHSSRALAGAVDNLAAVGVGLEPVMNLESLLARKRATDDILFRTVTTKGIRGNRGVGTSPQVSATGNELFTVILSGPHSRAADLIRARTASLARL